MKFFVVPLALVLVPMPVVSTATADPQGDPGGQPPVTICVGSADPSTESRCATATLTWEESDCTGNPPNRICSKPYRLTLAVGGTCKSIPCADLSQMPIAVRGNATVSVIDTEMEVISTFGPSAGSARQIKDYPITDPTGLDIQVTGVVCVAQLDWRGIVRSLDCKKWQGMVHLPGTNPADGSVGGFAGTMVGYATSLLSWDAVPLEVRVETPPIPPIPPDVEDVERVLLKALSPEDIRVHADASVP